MVVYLILVAFGWMNIYSTQSSAGEIFDFSRKHGAQLLWIIISLVTAGVVMIISSRFYSVFAYFIYGAVLFVLLSVLAIGVEVNGSKSWLDIGGFRFQPAELAKMATSLALARFMSQYEFKLHTLQNWLMIGAIIGTPVLLILLQRDWGSAIVFTSFFLMLYREGMSGYILAIGFFMIALFIASLLVSPVLIVYFLFLGALFIFLYLSHGEKVILIPGTITAFLMGFALFFLMEADDRENIILYEVVVGICLFEVIVASIYCLVKRYKGVVYTFALFILSLSMSYSVDYIFDNVLKSHHRDRIEDMLGIKEDRQGAGYNVYQSKVAIGSGGFSGKGYLNGTQTKLNFVPEQSTDFIFCTIGEEWGFVGSFITIFLYVFLLIRLILLSERQKDTFSRVYGYCVASVFFFHFVINIAMTIGLAPVIGIPLPFISAGGSSLWSFTIFLFIFLKLDAIRYSPD